MPAFGPLPALRVPHPAAELLPMMDDRALAELVADIREHGQIEPIVLAADGRILDGRARYEACRRLEREPIWSRWEGEPGTEAVYSLSRNLHRRHLDASQRAMVAARAREMLIAPGAGARVRPTEDGDHRRASQVVADQLAVSARSVDSAARVLRDGAPELVEAVDRREASVRAAADVATLPLEEQLDVVARGEREILEAAKRIRADRKRATQSALHSSESEEWYTPGEIVDIARDVMGGIDLDPASSAEANAVVGATKIYTADDDGRTRPWKGRVWLNPPYGRDENHESNQGLWSAKLLEEYAAGRVSAAILLVNAVTDRRWFRALWAHPICFLFERIAFRSPGSSAKKQPTHGNVLVYLGPDVRRFAGKTRALGHLCIPRGMIPALRRPTAKASSPTIRGSSTSPVIHAWGPPGRASCNHRMKDPTRLTTEAARVTCQTCARWVTR